MFQKNIVKNKNLEKYKKWFEFAEKTSNKENNEDDFKEYKNDEIFLEMMKKLRKDALTAEDMQHIKDAEEAEAFLRFEDKVYADGKKEGKKEGIETGIKKGKKIGIEEGKKVGIEEGKKVGIEEGEKKAKIETAKKLIKKGLALDDIFYATELPMNQLIELKNLSEQQFEQNASVPTE